jgi:hypothetical protein
MDTHSADSNDNDIKYEAYARFYNEKHSNWFKYFVRFLWKW